jgi:outer membrane receptor protein involved in Fe transport
MKSCARNIRCISAMAAALSGLWLGIPGVRAEETIRPEALEEIVVTATKRDRLLSDVPLTVSAFSGAMLQRMGATHFADYAPRVPGLMFTDAGPQQQKIFIRGVTSGSGAEESASVGIYMDEVPVTHSGAQADSDDSSPDLMLFDVARVEVLRGPQGTLFGAGSMSGTIRVIANEPDPSAYAATLEGGTSTTRRGGMNYDGRGMVNIPLSQDRLALRMSGYLGRNEGFIDNAATDSRDVNDERTSGLRVAASLLATETLTLNAKSFYQRVETDGRQESDSPAGFGRFEQNRQTPEPFTSELLVNNFEFRLELAGAELLSSTSRLRREVARDTDLTGFLEAALAITDIPASLQNRTDLDQFAQEVRLTSSHDGRLQWVAGAFYLDQDKTFTQDAPAAGIDPLLGGLTGALGSVDNLYEGDNLFDRKELAFFGEASYDLIDRIAATVGLRWSEVKLESDQRAQGLFNGGPTVNVGASTDSAVTPKLNLSYRASDNALVYLQVAKGFRVGGTNPQIPAGPCGADLEALGFSEAPAGFDPESIWNYEIGAKADLADRRVSLSGAAFYIDWKDLVTDQQLQCGFSFQANAGKARSKGVELSVLGRPWNGVELGFTGALVDAELRVDVPEMQWFSGDRTPNSPRVSFGTSAEYSVPVSDSASLFARIDHQHVGKSYTAFNSLDPSYTLLPAYDLVHLRTGVSFQSWELSLYARNLFDEVTTLQAQNSIFGVNEVRNRPRTIGLTVRASY